MKRFLFCFLLTLGALAQGLAQEPMKDKMTTPAELVKIMEKSKLSYIIEPADDKNKDLFNGSEIKGNKPSVPHHFYQTKIDDAIDLKTYEPTEETGKILEKAEAAFAENKMEEAQKYYLEAMKLMPENSAIMTYMGQTYGSSKDWKNAQLWYKKAIETNYIDYMAHWFLADLYATENKPQDALKEIIIAHVLNRNNPRLKISLDNILELNKIKPLERSFEPKYILKEKGLDGVRIIFKGEEWMIYALNKAVWDYEPGYRKARTGSEKNNVFSLEEERECIINLLLANEKVVKGKKTKDESLNLLSDAYEQKMVTEFIFYDIWMPNNPAVLLTQSKGFIEEVAKYYLKIHTK